MGDNFDRLGDLATRQDGIITRGQALAVGLTDKAIAVRLRTGRWRRVHTGVYATFSGPIPRGSYQWAAVLRAGPASVLSHHTAAELFGLLDAPVRLIHVTVPSGSQVRPPTGVAVHYSGRVDQIRHPALDPPRTRLEDSVIDMAEMAASLDEAVSVMLRAVGRRLTTASRIQTAMDQRPQVRRRRELGRALGLGAAGVHSLLEYRYVTRVERPHGLPHGVRQRRVARDGRSQYQDVRYEKHLLVVELDGRVAHPLESRSADTHRDNVNLAEGVATIRLGYLDVSEHACASAALVSLALRTRGWQGVPRRCGPGCLVQS